MSEPTQSNRKKSRRRNGDGNTYRYKNGWRTVIARFTDGIFQLDNFLIIGVIAAVRHILTVGASLTMEKEKTTEYFNRALTEMGVNTGIVLALVFALFLSRAASKNKPAK